MKRTIEGTEPLDAQTVQVWPFAEFLTELQQEVHWGLLRQHIVEPNAFTDTSLNLANQRVRAFGKQPR